MRRMETKEILGNILIVSTFCNGSSNERNVHICVGIGNR